MTIPRPALLRRVHAVVDATPSRIPVLLGGCGSGRSSLLRDLQARLGPDNCQYVDLERAAVRADDGAEGALVPGEGFGDLQGAHVRLDTGPR